MGLVAILWFMYAYK